MRRDARMSWLVPAAATAALATVLVASDWEQAEPWAVAARDWAPQPPV